jgi:peptide/nickel transport system permease protein
MWTLLWTDALLWLLFFCCIAYAIYVRKQAHLRAPWSRIAHSASGMSSAVVLAVFVVIAMLDSIHFRPQLEGQAADGGKLYAVEVRSVLDVLLEDLRTKNERTYSAPLAAHAFAKETVASANGEIRREFPRLRNGGAHLQDPAGRGTDIAERVAFAVGAALISWAAAVLLLSLALAHYHRTRLAETLGRVLSGRTDTAWRAVVFTLLCILLIAWSLAMLSGYYHVFGTNKVGQDVLYQVLKSIRTAIVIGGVTTLVTMPLGVMLGVMAGYYKGWVDDVVQYLYTTINSIPSVLLIVAFILMVQVFIDTHPELFETTAERADVRLLCLCVILGLTSWTGLARLLRGEALKLRELEYIQAAKAFGVRGGRIMTRHIVPNVMHIVLISLVMDFSGLVLAEAVLSYIGVGVDPSMNSFGSMINAARLEMARDPMVWWSLLSAFIFMFALVLAANLFADAVRDAFDPRMTLRPRLFGLRRSRA